MQSVAEDDDTLDPVERWFAANLKAAREQAGLSQEAVAAQMREEGHNWRQQTVAKIENGTQAVKLGEAHSVAQIVGSTAERLAWPLEQARLGMVLRGATGRLRKLRDEHQAAGEKLEQARQRLEKLVKDLRDSGHADSFADLIQNAERALEGR